MIADEMGTPINLPTVAATAREFAALGNWDGKKIAFEKISEAKPVIAEGKLYLTSWRLLLDLGTLQDGEANLAGTARKASARISKSRAEELGVSEGGFVSISSDLGSLKLPVEISDMANNQIWVPRNSIDSQVIANLGFVSGQVTVVKA
jgi:NADH-quinone oxidoreductase subunit G